MEINIYKLNSQPFSKSFPRLLEAISDRGISTLVHCSDEQEVKKCDALLWSYDQLSFLGHSIKGEVHTLPQKYMLLTLYQITHILHPFWRSLIQMNQFSLKSFLRLYICFQRGRFYSF